MSNFAPKQNSQHNNGNFHRQPAEGREVHYPDGITNIVWDTVGDEYDFIGPQHRYGGSSMWNRPGIRLDPSDVVGLTVMFDHQERPVKSRFVFIEGGSTMVRLDTDVDTGKTTFTYDPNPEALVESFCARPMTIGSRPNRLSGGKLVSVEAISPRMHDWDSNLKIEEKSNPLTVAIEIQLAQLEKAQKAK